MKYEFTGETRTFEVPSSEDPTASKRVTVRRIRAVKNFGIFVRDDAVETDFGRGVCEEYVKIHTGDLGGWIETEANLAQDDPSWVADEACVFGNAKVCECALVSEEARVYGEAIISGRAWIHGKATVHEFARVHGDAIVCGEVSASCGTEIADRAYVSGKAILSGDIARPDDSPRIFESAYLEGKGLAMISGHVVIRGHATISAEAWIHAAKDCDRIEICDGADISGKVRINCRGAGMQVRGTAQITTDENVSGWPVTIGDEVTIEDAACVSGYVYLENCQISGHSVIRGRSTGNLIIAGCDFAGGYADITSHRNYATVKWVNGWLLTFFKEAAPTGEKSLGLSVNGDYFPVLSRSALRELLQAKYSNFSLIEAVLDFADVAREPFPKGLAKQD